MCFRAHTAFRKPAFHKPTLSKLFIHAILLLIMGVIGPTLDAAAFSSTAELPASSAEDDVAISVLARLSGKTELEVKALRLEWKSWPRVVSALDLNIDIVRAEMNRARAGFRQPERRCPTPSVGLVPLTELQTNAYQGMEGGLYPGGSNIRPKAHEAAGLAAAHQIQPLSEVGEDDPEHGKIVLITIGMSNTTQESQAFLSLAAGDKEVNPQVILVDGAQGGMDTTKVLDAAGKGTGVQFWNTIKNRLATAGVTPAQVQVAWVKEAVASPSLAFPADAQSLASDLGAIARKLLVEFPNIKIAYFSSRTYGGYATTKLNPEPFAYQSGFAVKWLIEQQINGSPSLYFSVAQGQVTAPWIAWGPYLWTDGLTPRADGLIWECTDTAADGTHPSASGRLKVGQQLLQFLKTDSTAKPWFLREE